VNEPRLRPAVRGVVMDTSDRILLVRFAFPDRSMWACPGGGIEPGEDEESAIRRELAEEAGLTAFELGPCIWTRRHVVPLFGGRWDGQAERYYLVRTEPFLPQPHFSAEELAREYVTAIRWWTPSELAESAETFIPRRLRSLLDPIRRGELPDAPIDVGV
jgi:8-oxo-dGTP diphosphatase